MTFLQLNSQQSFFSLCLVDEQKLTFMFQASAKSPDLKKAGKAPHAQASVKEVSLPANSSNAWNRPRCGVPDYPAQKEVHYRVRNRQRRFVLYGGRLDRTDLTYRYRKCSQDYIFLVIMWIHHSCTHYLRLNIDFGSSQKVDLKKQLKFVSTSSSLCCIRAILGDILSWRCFVDLLQQR